MKTATIAIIGGGNMGTSLVGGLLADGYHGEKIWMADPKQERLNQLSQQFGVNTTTENETAIQDADIVILAVKPQTMHRVANTLSNTVQTKKPLVISIAAGIRESSLRLWLGDQVAIVRAMPNTPALIGCGATALFANKFVTPEQSNNAESILRAVGIVVWLQDEKLIDVVTAVSGSGPAYFFLMMEALQHAAEQQGLTPDVARLLTLQTAFGAGRMALESADTLSNLRKNVTSPGGTTEHGVRVLEEANIRSIMSNTVQAAKNRSEELAKMFETAE
jgi:pyrroline-5-carboxylate reductase